MHRMLNVCINDIVRTIVDPTISRNLNSQMPKDCREVRKVLQEVALGYTIIDCYPYNKFIYYGLLKEELKKCPKCNCP